MARFDTVTGERLDPEPKPEPIKITRGDSALVVTVPNPEPNTGDKKPTKGGK